MQKYTSKLSILENNLYIWLEPKSDQPILANGPRIPGHMIILLFILIETFQYTYNKM